MSTEEAKENTHTATQDLWRIAETNLIDQVESILANGADINASNEQGMTALMRAAARGRIQMVRVLLKHGANPNTSRNDKFTPLMLAAFFGHQEIVRILVEHGADTDATTQSGTSAQMWAASRTFKDVVRDLEKPPTSGKVSTVATVKDTRLGAEKPRETVSVNDNSNANSGTPTSTHTATQDLWRIAETNLIDQVESILANGADINASNEHGMTALMRAAARGRIQMVRILLKHGANPNTSRNDKFTPLMLAAFFGHREIVRILIEHGADTDETTQFGTSAQIWAASRTFKDVVRDLEKPPTSGKVSTVATVKDTRLGAEKHLQTVSLNDNSNASSGTLTIASESSLEKAVRLTESGSATLVSADQSFSDLAEVEAAIQHVAPIPPFLSRFQPLRRSILVPALTLLVAVALHTGLTLRQKQSLKQVNSQALPPVTNKTSAVAVRPSAADTSPSGGEATTIAISDTQANKMAIGNVAGNLAGVSALTNNYKTQIAAKPPLAIRSEVSTDDSGTNRSETENGVTNVSQPSSSPTRTPEEVRSTESLATVATKARPLPAISRDPTPMKKPAPLSTQLITGSTSSSSNGKVIQWPP